MSTHGPAQIQLVPLGHLVNVHATRGELRMRPYNPGSTTLHADSIVVLRRDAEQHARRVTAVRPHKRLLLLTLEGVTSMTAAEALIGYEVCVRETDLPPTGPDEVYHYELVGMAVMTTAGADLGRVEEVLATGSNDVCVVRGNGCEHLIPLIGDVVKRIDRAQRLLVIEPLPGLLEE